MNSYKYFFCCLIFFVGLGCQNKKNNLSSLEKDTIQNNVLLDHSIVAKSFVLDGVWIRLDYISSLKKTNSPLKSFNELKDISSIKISESDIKSKFKASLSLNNVESSEAIFSYDSLNNLMIKLYWGEGYVSTKVEINGDLMTFNLKGKKFVFKKIGKTKEEDEFGIQEITNKILFGNNTYTCFDDKNKSCFVNVKFLSDGTVVNFGTYEKYELQTSFIVDVNPKDCIILKTSSNDNKKNYHFDIKGKFVYLYDIIKIKDTLHEEDDEDYEDIEKLKLVYILKNKK